MTRHRGFTLIELLIGIVTLAVLATALTRILLSDSRFVSKQEALITARQTARAAMNVMSVELRMVSDGGLLAAGADSVFFRSPYAYGVACGVASGARAVSLMPADSAMYASAVPSGIARRRAGGQYSFLDGITVAASADATPCTADSVRIVPDGSLVAVTPDTAALSGELVYLYQNVAYKFMASTDMPGRIALWRRAGLGAYEELAAPFDSTARFRFLVGPNLQRTGTPPADLTTVNGLELSIVAQSYEPPQGQSEFQLFELPLQVVFLNKAN
ncbi:MAG: prepilin-type N-terminal cleavage/methylation domain-containing protein [Gemmatimonadota bacterium]|nr:MAG: prepilin-type N-terminal cleavage/methylation domain-containing protein [Gemmatimonadota bacterium]